MGSWESSWFISLGRENPALVDGAISDLSVERASHRVKAGTADAEGLVGCIAGSQQDIFVLGEYGRWIGRRQIVEKISSERRLIGGRSRKDGTTEVIP